MEKHIEILVDRTEYITKEEAYKAINEQYHETGLDGYQDGIELMNRIAKIPVTDVVEVVRCGECIYWRGENDICKGICIDFSADGYCSEGKRKDGGKDDV